MADFRIRVVVDPRPAVAGADKVERRLKRLSGTADRLRTQFATLLGGTGVVIAFAMATRVLANFEQTMSTVKAITGATEAEFTALTETAKELGATTRFTASQAGEGLIFLARAGFEVNEAMETVDDTLLLAQAGALELGRAAEITAGVLRGMRLETDQAQRVVDVMAFTANSAATDVGQLGQALSFVAPIASGLNVSLEETTAAIAALSNANIKATRAGTGLTRVLAELETPGTVATEIFAKLGVTTDQVRVSEVGLTQALKVLKGAGIDAGQSLEAFGKRGGPAFEVLANSISTVEGMNKKLQDVEGTAQRVADIMDDNLNGALLKVKSAAEAVVLSFGELGASNFLTKLFLGMATSLRGLAKHLDTVLRLFKALTIVMTVVFAQRAVPAVIAGFKAVTAQVNRLTLAIAANPLGALAIAIVAIVALLVSFRDKIKLTSEGAATLGDLFSVAADIIKEGLGGAITFVTNAFKFLGVIFDFIFGDIELSLATVLRGLARLADFIANTFTLSLRVILTFVEKLPGALKEAFIVGLNFVLTAVEGGINKIVSALNNIPGVDIELVDVPKLENTAKGAGKELGLALIQNFKDTLGPGVATDLVNRLLREAEEKAQARIAASAVAAGGPGGPEAPGEPATTPEVTGGGVDPLQTILGQLKQEQELLQMRGRAREVASELISIERELKEEGRELTEVERALVTTSLERLQALSMQAELLEQIKGPQEELILQQQALNELRANGLITLREFNDEQLVLQQRLAETSNTLSGGLAAGLLEIGNRMQDVGKNVQTFVTGAFDKATDALVNFATTGKFEFRAFVADLLQQLAKLSLQLALTAALRAALESQGGGGLIGGLLKGAVSATAQNGLDGTIAGSGGTDSQLVAFRGTPGERVQVQTPGQQAGDQQPIVVQAPPVQITNVQSADDIPLGIESAEGEQAVLNVLSRNKDAVQALTG